MDRETVFVDTWGWMALGHRREPSHAEVKRIYRELCSNGIPLYTSDYVLDELITLLFRREVFEGAMRFVEGILGAAVLGQLRIERGDARPLLCSLGTAKAISGQANHLVH